MNAHAIRVADLQALVRGNEGEWRRKRGKDSCSFRCESTNELCVEYDLSELTHILSVDDVTERIRIESGVSMESLVRELRDIGFYPPVLTEFRHMTFGGAVVGLGGESSSIHHGFIHESVLEYTILDGAGNVVVATPTNEHKELYDAIPGSNGTLGILLSMEIQCVRRPAYVRCTYELHPSTEHLRQWWKDRRWDEVDFVEGVGVSKTHVVALYGVGVDSCCDAPHRSFESDTSLWFYDHMKTKTSGEVEILSFEDYVFRWDRGAFFNASMRMTPTWLTRTVYGSQLSAKSLYARARRKPIAERECRKLNQDMMVPIDSLDIFLKNDRHISYPIWLLPMRSKHKSGLFTFPSPDEMYVDVGTYCTTTVQPFDFVAENRDLEHVLYENKGIKCFWNQAYLTEEEFWQYYDRTKYESIRTKYKMTKRGGDVYKKTCSLLETWSRPRDLPKDHRDRVERIQTGVRGIPEGKPIAIERRKTNYTMHHSEYKPPPSDRVDVSDLDHILEVDPINKIAWVETGVTMEKLVNACLRLNLLPLVLPELKHLTVGGLISGAGLETSSFRYGQFNDTCTDYDVVLGNGELVRCNSSVHADLYHGLSGAFGTLGIVTAVRIRLRPAAPFVTLAYHGFDQLEEAMTFMEKETRKLENDFVEGIQLDSEKTAVIIGRLGSREEAIPEIDLQPWNAPWFTEHVGNRLETDNSAFDQISLTNYLFRHDRGAFWTGEEARMPVPFLGKVNVGRMKWLRKALYRWFDT